MPGSRTKLMALVLAGGEGTRLQPLTRTRCKPSLPFDADHRIVDFVLSNLVNSGFATVHLLVQHQSGPLIEHVRKVWSTRCGLSIQTLGPRLRGGLCCFNGTADAVAQNLHLVESFRPDLVAVFAADHVYRMDVRQMVDEHLAQGAEVSIATLPVPLRQCPRMGIVDADAAGWVRAFQEKPRTARPMAQRPGHARASMGNYLFDADVLLHELRHPDTPFDADFGRDVLPRLVSSRRVRAYDFARNRIPGTGSFEEPGYWRDVGTLEAYFDAHFDTLGTRPRFRLDNPAWPIHPCAQRSRRAVAPTGSARIERACLRPDVAVEDGARVEQSIVMDRCVVGRGARLVRAIVDDDNHVPDGETIGGDLERMRGRFHVSENGIVVVPRGYFPPQA